MITYILVWKCLDTVELLYFPAKFYWKGLGNKIWLVTGGATARSIDTKATDGNSLSVIDHRLCLSKEPLILSIVNSEDTLFADLCWLRLRTDQSLRLPDDPEVNDRAEVL